MTAKGQLLIEEDLFALLKDSFADIKIKEKYNDDVFYCLDGSNYSDVWQIKEMPENGKVNIICGIDDEDYNNGTASFSINFFIDDAGHERFISGEIKLDGYDLLDKPIKRDC